MFLTRERYGVHTVRNAFNEFYTASASAVSRYAIIFIS